MSEKRKAEYDALMNRLSSRLSGEQVAQLNAVFDAAPEAAFALAEETMAKSDYTRNIQELQSQRAQLTVEQSRIAELAQKVDAYDQHLSTNYLPRAEYETALAEKQLLQNQLDQLKAANPEFDFEATANSYSNNGGNMNTNPNGGVPQAPPSRIENPIKHVSELQYQQGITQAVSIAAISPAIQHDLAVRHSQLFNAPLSDMTGLVNEAMQTGKQIQDVWAEKYNVPQREQEIQKEQFEQAVAAKVNEEVAKRVSTGIIGGNAGIGQNQFQSPFLQQMQVPVEQRTGVTGAPDMNRIHNQGSGHGTAANRATEAFLSGKYKDEKFSILSS